jgi:hypothetical protein
MYNRLAALSVGLMLCFSGFAPTYAANSAPACDLKRVAELETKIEQNDFLIKVQLNDRDSWLNVATASPFSVISRKIADELKLSKKEIESADLYDGAGKTISKFVSIKTVGLAGMKAENVQFLIMGSAMTPPKPGEHDFEGGFGAEFLSAYDVELDLLHGKMALFRTIIAKGMSSIGPKTMSRFPLRSTIFCTSPFQSHWMANQCAPCWTPLRLRRGSALRSRAEISNLIQ